MNNPTNFTDPLGLDEWGNPPGYNPTDPCSQVGYATSHAECGNNPNPVCQYFWVACGGGGGFPPGLPPVGGGGGGGGSGGQAGAMPGNAAFPSVEVICSSTGPIGGPLGPPTCTIVITGPGGTKTKLSDLLQWGKNLMGEYLNLLALARKVPIAGTAFVPLTASKTLGVGFTWALNPNCFGIGPMLSTPSQKYVSGGPLIHGNLDNSKAILSQWGSSANIQASDWIGYQAIWNSSGVLGGATAATSAGASIWSGYTWCAE